MNLDIFSLIGDVTDSGQIFNAMTMHFGRKGLEAGKPPGPVDAVVHFAAIPRVFIKTDNETYRVNVMGTYNVIEAAMKLGIRKVVIASSETTYGTADLLTAEFLAKWCPGVPVTRPMIGHEAPLSNRKAREVLGFKEQHNWRDQVKALPKT